jgi:hypothetical protein
VRRQEIFAFVCKVLSSNTLASKTFWGDFRKGYHAFFFPVSEEAACKKLVRSKFPVFFSGSED